MHFSHWLGAVVTCWRTIGRKDTPVRAVLNKAAELVPKETLCISMVVKSRDELWGLYVGDRRESWSMAADLSAQVHVVRKNGRFIQYWAGPRTCTTNSGWRVKSCTSSNP